MKKHTQWSSFKLFLFFAFVVFLVQIPLLGSEEKDEADSVAVKAPDIEVFLSEGISQWSENNPFMKKISTTAFWHSLELSEQFIGILTAGNEVEREVGQPIGKPLIDELLGSPVELSVWDAFEKDTDTPFVAVMDLKPSFSALVKLASAYAESIKKSSPMVEKGFKILQTDWLSKTLFHTVQGNQLVLSNNKNCLAYILGKVPKGGSIKTFRDSAFFKNFHENQKGNFKCRIDLSVWLKNLKGLLDKENMQLALNGDLKAGVEFYSIFITAKEGFKAKDLCSLDDCKQFIPKEPMAAAAGLISTGYYLEMLDQLLYFNESKGTGHHADVQKDLVPVLTERFFVYLTGLRDTGHPNIINGVIGFSLAPYTPAQREKLLSFVQWLMKTGDEPKKKETLEKGLDIYRSTEDDWPAFCIVDRWLLIGSGVEPLKESLAVYKKKKANISDGSIYQKLETGFIKKGFFHVFVDPVQCFKALASHIDFLAESATDYNAADVEKKITPATDVFAGIPAFGIFMDLENANLKGQVTFVDSKK